MYTIRNTRRTLTNNKEMMMNLSDTVIDELVIKKTLWDDESAEYFIASSASVDVEFYQRTGKLMDFPVTDVHHLRYRWLENINYEDFDII